MKGLWDNFWEEVRNAKANFLGSDVTLYDSHLQSGIRAYLLYGAIATVSAVVLSTRPTKIWLCCCEVLAWLMVGLAVWMPTTFTRFYYGIIFFGTGMCIHSRIMLKLMNHAAEGGSVATEWLNILYLNTLDRIYSEKGTRSRNISRIAYGVVAMLCADACIYLIREWIPNNVNPKNQEPLTAVTGAMWILFVLDVGYAICACQLDLLGAPLPTELWHCHPLLSSSLSEFWGVRWNPVVGKLLQDSFYKPLRRVGASRPACMVAAFAGSALLHMVPAYIALKDTHQVALIGMFFALQGSAVLTEMLVQRLWRRIVGPGQKTNSGRGTCNSGASSAVTVHAAQLDADLAASGAAPAAPPRPGSTRQVAASHRSVEDQHARRQAEARAYAIIAKSAPYQFVAELLLILCILCAYFCYGEFRDGYTLSRLPSHITSQQRGAWLAVTTALGVGTLTCYYIVRSYIHTAMLTASASTSANYQVPVEWEFLPLPLRDTVFTLVSWLWAVAAMLVLLPLYSLPMLRVAEQSHAQSVLVGPLIRALWR